MEDTSFQNAARLLPVFKQALYFVVELKVSSVLGSTTFRYKIGKYFLQFFGCSFPLLIFILF